MKLSFTAEARLELLHAITYYELIQPDLGTRLRNLIVDLTGKIERNPFQWAKRPGGYHRANCPAFPYYLAYVVRHDHVIVVAVAHAKRKPGYWGTRGEKL